VNTFERAHLAAQGYFELEMYEEAIRVLDRLSFEDQLRSEVLELRVVVQMKACRWKEALVASERLCAMAPDVPIGFIHAAFCLHELGCTREAKELLLEGPPSLVKEATYHYNLACYECVLGNLETAQAYLETSVSLDFKLREFAKEDPDLKPLHPAKKKKK
jgi:tetratricopeptide (TPR) repeat protein